MPGTASPSPSAARHALALSDLDSFLVVVAHERPIIVAPSVQSPRDPAGCSGRSGDITACRPAVIA
jgi:hypothetical protein